MAVLPKGRPSAYRVADESATSGTTTNKGSETAPEPVKPTSIAVPSDADASTKTNADAIQFANPSTSESSVLAGLLDTSRNVSTAIWPPLETLSWDNTQLEVDWSRHDSSHVDAVLPSLDPFGDDGSAREESDPSSPTQPLYPPSPSHPHAYAHGQPGGGIFEKHDGSTSSNMNKSIGGCGDGTMNISLDKFMNWPSSVIAQLSQLSTRLSLLHYSSYTLSKAAESSSYRLPNDQQNPLIDPAAFQSVATWLSCGHTSANMNEYLSVHTPAESQCPYPSPVSETTAKGNQGILNDVFSASHRLLEILSHLQAKMVVEPSNSSTPSTAPLGQSSVYLGLNKDLWSSAPSSGIQQHRSNTMQIIRHLVIACEALLLEIYMAVLIALQHDAYHGVSMNTTALGNVQLVLVVQLCSYFIERQHQAVDLFLTPQSPLSSRSVSGTFSQRLDLSGSQQPIPAGPVLDMAEKEVLSDLKNQVQQRLAHLRQTLRCT